MKLFNPDTTDADWRVQVESDVDALSSEMKITFSVLGASERDEWLSFNTNGNLYNIHSSIRVIDDDSREDDAPSNVFIRIFNSDGTKLLYTYNTKRTLFHTIDDYVSMYTQALESSGILSRGDDYGDVPDGSSKSELPIPTNVVHA